MCDIYICAGRKRAADSLGEASEGSRETHQAEYDEIVRDSAGRCFVRNDFSERMRVMNESGAKHLTSDSHIVFGEISAQAGTDIDGTLAAEAIVGHFMADDYALVTHDMLGDEFETPKALCDDMLSHLGCDPTFEFTSANGEYVIPGLEVSYANTAAIEAILSDANIYIFGMRVIFHRRARFEALAARATSGIP